VEAAPSRRSCFSCRSRALAAMGFSVGAAPSRRWGSMGARHSSQSRIATPRVIARRAAPWQSMSLHYSRWIASFLAMTGSGCNDGVEMQRQGRAMTERGAMTGSRCNERIVAITQRGAMTTPRHCEAHGAVAIHVFALRPMDCFVPRNDRAGAQ
jgi:hypothetical protein